jgi:hypothetical protein
MNPYSSDIEQQMLRLYKSLNEKDRRRYGAIEAAKLGWGGISYISALFRCDYYTIRLGLSELDDAVAMNQEGIRAKGGGRKSAFETVEGLDEVFIEVLEEHTLVVQKTLRRLKVLAEGHCVKFNPSAHSISFLKRGTSRRRIGSWQACERG